MSINVSQRGFILLVVLGILGVLGALGVSFAHQAQISGNLSSLSRQSTEALLNARSGVELALSHVIHLISTDPRGMQSPSGLNWTWAAEPNSSYGVGKAIDLSGTININDGIEAGRLESEADHSFIYSSHEIDPWDSLGGVENDSGRINLRLRRLLNAYGDAHRFDSFLGRPVWKNSDFQADRGNYGQSFTFTATAYGDRFTSLPALDFAAAPIAAISSRALGDRIIGMRPNSGFRNLDEIKDIVNEWAAESFIDSNGIERLAEYLSKHGVHSFFELIKNDLSINSDEDSSFYRMSKEFGIFHNSTNGTVPPVRQISLDHEPPDLANLWWPHSVALININRASFYVRTAIFYAPTNVGYVCEGVKSPILNVRKLANGVPAAVSPYVETGLYRQFSECRSNFKTLGVSGPAFRFQHLRENGIRGLEGVTRQAKHLMSLRDAMVLATGYEEYTGLAYTNPIPSDGFEHSIPDGFDQFHQWLVWMSQEAVAPERAPQAITNFINGGDRHYDRFFRKNYLARTLPHIYSGVRRMPGWMHAPIALLSAYHQTRRPNQINNLDSEVFRSVEDFVYRHHLPKISFSPSGRFKVTGTGHFNFQGHVARRSISVECDFLTTVRLRTQKSFLAYTDPSSDQDIQIGPEPKNVPPSPFLGTVGLKDRMGDPLTGGQPLPAYGCALPFAGDLLPRLPKIAVNEFNPHDIDLEEVGPSGVVNYYPNFLMPFSAQIQSDLDALRMAGMPATGKTFKVPLDPLTVINGATSGKSFSGVAEAVLWIESNLSGRPGYPGDGKSLDHYIWWLSTLGKVNYPPNAFPSPHDITYGEPPLDNADFDMSPNWNLLSSLRNYSNTDVNFERPLPADQILSNVVGAVYVYKNGRALRRLRWPNRRATPDVWLNWLRNPANRIVFRGQYPGDGLPMDAYSWVLTGAYNESWSTHYGSGNYALPPGSQVVISIPTFYPSRWASNSPVPHASLEDSQLEGDDTSLFLVSHDGSDLSPFGGVSLGSRGHGNWSQFNDSLFWNPENILSNQKATGEIFNKSFMSLWYRNPSGFRVGTTRKSLLHATLWEHVQLEPTPALGENGIAIEFQNVYRPIYFDLEFSVNSAGENIVRAVYSQGVMNTSTGYTGVNMFSASGGFYPDVVPPYNSMSLALVRHKDFSGNPTPQNYLGINHAAKASDYRDWFQQDLIPPAFPNKAREAMIRQVKDANDRHLSSSGVWNRVLVCWDQSSLQSNNDRLWMDIPTTDVEPTALTIFGPPRISGNNKMIVSVGERPYFRHHNLQVVMPAQWGWRTFDSDNPNGTIFSAGRFDSLIDNVDLRFGYPSGVKAGGPFGGNVNRFVLDNNSVYSDYRSKRYNISTESESVTKEPKWILNPKFEKGSRLVSFSARIYDVPDLGVKYNSPAVDLTTHSQGAPTAFNYTTPQRNFVSSEIRNYAGDAVDSTTRFYVTYKSVDPSGNFLKDRLTDIPWIQEVSWQVIPSSGIKLMNFKIDWFTVLMVTWHLFNNSLKTGISPIG